MGSDVFRIAGTTQASHFVVEEAAAEGGFAVVYRARHAAFRAPVALKCLKVPATLTDHERETFLEKFREEAELLFQLSAASPAVVRPLQVGTLDLPDRFVPFLAMEWLDGESLDVVRDRRTDAGLPPLDVRTLVRMLTPVAQALAEAHSLKGPSGPVVIVHCDLKPDNMFLTRRGAVETMKILDFGIARVKSAAQSVAGGSTPTDGVIVTNAFTPQYAAPEQWRPDLFGQTGPWTDVFGLAISMVDVLSGEAPIDGSLADMVRAALDTEKRPSPRSMGVKVSEDIEEAFVEALAVDPKRRTKSIERFWSALEISLGVKQTFRPTLQLRETDSIAPPPGWDRPSHPPASRASSPLLQQPMRERGAWRMPSAPDLDAHARSSLAVTIEAPRPLGAPAGSARARAVSSADPVEVATRSSHPASGSFARPPTAEPPATLLGATARIGIGVAVCLVASAMLLADAIHTRTATDHLFGASAWWLAAPLLLSGGWIALGGAWARRAKVDEGRANQHASNRPPVQSSHPPPRKSHEVIKTRTSSRASSATPSAGGDRRRG